jgi:hypothetical protein
VADRLISIDTAEAAGSQLPAPVRDEVILLAQSNVSQQRARYGARTVGAGDSIMGGATTASAWNQTRGGWITELARLSMGRIDLVHKEFETGTGIDTRLDNFDDEVAAYSPETVLLANGTNNVSSTPPMSLETYLTKLTTYYGLVRGVGAQLIMGGIYPKNVDKATISTWNAALVEWAKPKGVLVIPFWELANPDTGEWPDGWSSDGTHPLRESPAYAELGKLAWKTVERAYTEPVAPTARYAGEGIYTDFFTNLTTTITGVATISGISATTGTLVAGAYSYRVVARNYWGKSPTYNDASITLGATGGVTFTVGGSGAYTRRAVYRKGPSDSKFKYIGQVVATGTQTFTDDGSLASQYDWVGGDSSRVPVGLINGATQDLHTLAYGPPIQTDPDIRGNFLRLTRQEGSANPHADRFLIAGVTGLTPGSEIVIAVKCRGANTAVAAERIQLQFRDPTDATTIDNVPLIYHRLSAEWGLAFGKFVVPTGSDRMRLSFEGDAICPYIDIAEVRVD